MFELSDQIAIALLLIADAIGLITYMYWEQD
jgi:hypothetical protein